MQIIERIEISYFRSFAEPTQIAECSDVNIFSGANDSGKSNILRALNLFFSEDKTDFYDLVNFDRDFSKKRAENINRNLNKKKFFRISICFKKVNFDSTVLPDIFWVEKVWDKDGRMTTRKTKNKKRQALYDPGEEQERKQTKVETATTKFLNKIEFVYVPAIKDKSFFSYLKKEYQESLGSRTSALSDVPKGEEKTLAKWVETLTVGDLTSQLDKKIGQESLGLMERFKKHAHEVSESTFAIPDLKIDFAEVLEIATENNIYLPFRGDGVQAKFIPQILDEISVNKKSQMVIWGFEEPENSLEYTNAQQLADELQGIHSRRKQIFITSHAFNFVSMRGEGVSRFRVFNRGFEYGTGVSLVPERSQLTLLGLTDEEQLQEELGILDLNQKLKEEYNLKKKELEKIKKLAKEKEAALRARPLKIFACEDSSKKTINLWEELMKLFEIEDVVVLSTEGAKTDIIENGVMMQKQLDHDYQPKIFRQLDRDGMDEGQISEIQDYYMGKHKNLDYRVSFLPVHDIESFAVLKNIDLFDDSFWGRHEQDIVNSFERKAHSLLYDWHRKLNFSSKNFSNSTGTNPTALMQKMRAEALQDKEKYLSGKEICKKLGDFSPVRELKNSDAGALPQDLKDYLFMVKSFFEG